MFILKQINRSTYIIFIGLKFPLASLICHLGPPLVPQQGEILNIRPLRHQYNNFLCSKPGVKKQLYQPNSYLSAISAVGWPSVSLILGLQQIVYVLLDFIVWNLSQVGKYRVVPFSTMFCHYETNYWPEVQGPELYHFLNKTCLRALEPQSSTLLERFWWMFVLKAGAGLFLVVWRNSRCKRAEWWRVQLKEVDWRHLRCC